MELHDLNEFFRLSAILNLQLSATAVGRRNILSILLGRQRLPEEEWQVLLQVLAFLDQAYGSWRRRLGSMAVLHPLRATSLLARAGGQVQLVDLVCELLHDKLEDVTPEVLGDHYREGIEQVFQDMVQSIDPRGSWRLLERLDGLTRRDGETYFRYIGRMLDRAASVPALVSVKLADRLDNTLDMRIDIEDPIQGVDFFATIFQTMWVNNYGGYVPPIAHPPPSPLNGATRLYQLFKNSVLLSLIRQKQVALDDPVAQALFRALATASMKEAQRIVLHIFAYHQTRVLPQREMLMEAMNYAQRGGLDGVTLPNEQSRLDGLFKLQFEDSKGSVRARKLQQLYQDKSLMVEAGMSFVVIFLSFLNNPDYYIQGICEEGICPDRYSLIPPQ